MTILNKPHLVLLAYKTTAAVPVKFGVFKLKKNGALYQGHAVLHGLAGDNLVIDAAGHAFFLSDLALAVLLVRSAPDDVLVAAYGDTTQFL